MKDFLKIIFALAILFHSLASIAQTLGNYPDATVTAGQNTTISPDATPASSTSAVAYTNTNFSGLLMVNPISGVVSVTDAKQAGTYIVTVKAFGAVPITRTFTLTVINPNCSQGLFRKVTNVMVGFGGYSIAIGDFNGDGKQDIAKANSGLGFNSVSIRLGNGLGGFVGSTEVKVGGAPFAVAVGDFNGDGKQDIVTANSDINTISIRYGNGTGGFSGNTEVNVGSSPSAVAVGDFNGDGKQDIAIVNRFSSNVSIRMGDGTGSFSGSSNIDVGYDSRSLAIGDFNGDGKQDIVTASESSSNVSIRIGDGTGGFSGSTNINVGNGPRSVAIGDFNGDGKQDFTTANSSSNNVSIRLGDGTGGFNGNTEVSVGNAPQSIAIGDFNGDGKQDIAATADGNKVAIRLGDGSGGFTGNTQVTVGEKAYSIFVGDFNSDGIQDIAATENNDDVVTILLGNGEGNNTWLGITTDWNSPSNWSLSLVPTACSQVIINTGVPNMPTLTGVNNTCYTLSLQNGATVTLAKDAKLNITGKSIIQPIVQPPVSGSLYLVGNGSPGGWSNTVGNPQVFTKLSNTLYEITINLIADGSLLFLPVPGSWAIKYGWDGPNNANNVNGDNLQINGGDIKVPAASGSYKISVIFQSGKFTIIPQ